jgi:hypothetical protein
MNTADYGTYIMPPFLIMRIKKVNAISSLVKHFSASVKSEVVKGMFNILTQTCGSEIYNHKNLVTLKHRIIPYNSKLILKVI